jgi:hypothetical protein
MDPTQDGCIPASITTLFEPHSHCSFATNPEKRAAFELPEAALDWRQVFHGEEDPDSLDVIRLTDTVPRPRGWSWERWELWQAEGWWDRLWAQLVQSGPSSRQDLPARSLRCGSRLLISEYQGLSESSPTFKSLSLKSHRCDSGGQCQELDPLASQDPFVAPTDERNSFWVGSLKFCVKRECSNRSEELCQDWDKRLEELISGLQLAQVSLRQNPHLALCLSRRPLIDSAVCSTFTLFRQG